MSTLIVCKRYGQVSNLRNRGLIRCSPKNRSPPYNISSVLLTCKTMKKCLPTWQCVIGKWLVSCNSFFPWCLYYDKTTAYPNVLKHFPLFEQCNYIFIRDIKSPFTIGIRSWIFGRGCGNAIFMVITKFQFLDTLWMVLCMFKCI